MPGKSIALALWLCVLVAMPATAQTGDDVSRCLKWASIYERHVGKNASSALPSMPVYVSVAIETCRAGEPQHMGMLEEAMHKKGYGPMIAERK